MKWSRTWWLVFAAGATVMIAALLWITVVVLDLERAERSARSDAAHQEALRLALWRMDSWLAPHLAREASRPSADYESLAPAPQAYTAELSPIEAGQVLTPSPLINSPSPYIQIHFQVDSTGRITSPQAPSGECGELLAGDILPTAKIEASAARLGRVASMVTPEVLGCAPITTSTPPAPRQPLQFADNRDTQTARNYIEAQKRRQTAQMANASVVPQLQTASQPAPAVGPFVSIWVNDELMFLRSVADGNDRIYQGFLADWPALRTALLTEIADLFPEASLQPIRRESANVDSVDIGLRLATLPVALIAPTTATTPAGLTPARLTLALTWLAVLAGIMAVAGSLRASVAFGRTRSRFASAVTHELRTPLTTFRLYTDLLASGMITDEQKRREYLKTLDEESARLSTLVENVLGYARLEEGRRRCNRQSVSMPALVERLAAPLHRRARAGGMSLEVRETPGAAELHTDIDAVEQILFNLVDNACKYAGDNGDRTIELTVSLDNTSAHFDLQDHGSGIPSAHAAAVFSPFVRGEHADDPSPGLGLGLSLSRGLARELGGELVLVPTNGTGACFRLTLPLNRS